MSEFTSVCVYIPCISSIGESKIRKRKNFRNFLLLRFDYREIIAMAQRTDLTAWKYT